jgi:hypothetical protein
MKWGISQASMELPELATSCNFETGAVVYKGHRGPFLSERLTNSGLDTSHHSWQTFTSCAQWIWRRLKRYNCNFSIDVRLKYNWSYPNLHSSSRRAYPKEKCLVTSKILIQYPFAFFLRTSSCFQVILHVGISKEIFYEGCD